MKILVSSDWHSDWTTYGFPRFNDVQGAVQESIKVAIKEEIDLYAFTGDLCDPDDGPRALQSLELAMTAADTLHCNHIPSIWIPGNHDVIEDGSGRTTLTPLRTFASALRMAEFSPLVEERLRLIRLAGATVLALPFTASSHPYDPMSFAKWEMPSGKPIIVLAHLTVPGVQPGEETTEMPRGREVLLPLKELAQLPGKVVVVCGHYHRRQDFKSPEGVTVHIPGSLARLTFSEEGNKPSFMLLEV